MDPKALIQVKRMSWTKFGGLAIKVPNCTTFIFYFENVEEVDTVLQRVL